MCREDGFRNCKEKNVPEKLTIGKMRDRLKETAPTVLYAMIVGGGH